MENEINLLKAVGDETRIKIIKMLLKHSHCVGAISEQLQLTEAAISQHLKVLKEVNLITGDKRGYFMHYQVNRKMLQELSNYFLNLTQIEQENCNPDKSDCAIKHKRTCQSKRGTSECSSQEEGCCHDIKERNSGHDHCKCHDLEEDGHTHQECKCHKS